MAYYVFGPKPEAVVVVHQAACQSGPLAGRGGVVRSVANSNRSEDSIMVSASAKPGKSIL